MSIPTDIAALKILAEVSQEKNNAPLLHTTLHTLVNHVTYIHHAAWYESEEEDPITAVHVDEDRDVYAGTLRFPVAHQDGGDLGTLVVATKESVAFDVTDLPTLQTVADYIGQWRHAH